MKIEELRKLSVEELNQKIERADAHPEETLYLKTVL